MTKKFYTKGYDLDYYFLILRDYLDKHRFPEAEDELFISSRSEHAYDVFVESRLSHDSWYMANEKAMATLFEGFSLSPYDFISQLLQDEFYDHISLEDESIEFWTYTFLDELAEEFKGITLGNKFLDTTEGAVFKLTIIGRMALYFEENGL